MFVVTAVIPTGCWWKFNMFVHVFVVASRPPCARSPPYRILITGRPSRRLFHHVPQSRATRKRARRIDGTTGVRHRAGSMSVRGAVWWNVRDYRRSTVHIFRHASLCITVLNSARKVMRWNVGDNGRSAVHTCWRISLHTSMLDSTGNPVLTMLNFMWESTMKRVVSV